MPAHPSLPDEFYRAIGYRRAGAHAFRVDVFEEVGEAVHALGRRGPFAVTRRLVALAGGSAPLAAALLALGAHSQSHPDGTRLYRLRPRAGEGRGRRKGARPRADSPFAALGDLWSGR